MHKIYNKKLQSDGSNPRLGLLVSSTLELIIQTTANFALPFRFKPIT